jgi:hypothetical protein
MEQCDRFTPPLFLLFFVLSGADLDLSVLPSVGLIGVGYLLLRSIGKWGGTMLGAVCVKATATSKSIWASPAAPGRVAIGMASLWLPASPPWHTGEYHRAGGRAVFELIGPIITKIALTRAGEITRANKSVSSSGLGGVASGAALLLFYKKTQGAVRPPVFFSAVYITTRFFPPVLPAYSLVSASLIHSSDALPGCEPGGLDGDGDAKRNVLVPERIGRHRFSQAFQYLGRVGFVQLPARRNSSPPHLHAAISAEAPSSALLWSTAHSRRSCGRRYH